MAGVDEVEKYYEEWTARYLEVYGNVIQAYRPSATTGLLDYTLESMGLHDGLELLDAGCGVCGPAIHFAERLALQIDAITLSSVQYEIALAETKRKNLQSSIHVKKGDFHFLAENYPGKQFDGVYFLESLGHSDDPEIAIHSAWQVMKTGGFIFIKDFFLRETENPTLAAAFDKVKANINKNYAYNVPDLQQILSALRRKGFEIEFIRKPAFANDIHIRSLFETCFGIDLYEGKPELVPAEWLEIKCRKNVYESNEAVKDASRIK